MHARAHLRSFKFAPCCAPRDATARYLLHVGTILYVRIRVHRIPGSAEPPRRRKRRRRRRRPPSSPPSSTAAATAAERTSAGIRNRCAESTACENRARSLARSSLSLSAVFVRVYLGWLSLAFAFRISNLANIVSGLRASASAGVPFRIGCPRHAFRQCAISCGARIPPSVCALD